MIAFIFVGIPLICIIALIVMGCSGGSKSSRYKGNYVFLEDEDGEIVDSYIDKSGMQRGYLNDDDDEDDYPGAIRMADSSIMTDDDDYVDEFGEDGLWLWKKNEKL